MATTYTTRAAIRKPALADRDWHTPINENADLLDGVQAVGALAARLAEIPSASLNIKVGAGDYIAANGTIASFAGSASFALTASGTRYVYLTDAGTLTDGAAWPGADHVRIAVVVTGGTTISSLADARVPFRSTGAGGGSHLPLSGGSMSGDIALAAGSDLVFDTSTGSVIATAAAQKVGFWGATPVVRPASADQTALTDSTGGSVANATLGDAATAWAFTVSTGGSASTSLAGIALPTSMSGSTGGSSDGSWQSIPAPSDSPSDADALRDDLEATVLPAIRNNFAEVAAELALIRTAMVVVKDSITSIGDDINLLAADAVTSNSNVAKVAELANALRSALVATGLIKGSS